MTDSFWLSVASGAIIGTVLAIFFVIKTKGKKGEMKTIREHLRQTYPSDMSLRCYPAESLGAFSKDTLLYLIAEGDNVIFVSGKDMQPKFQIPIDRISYFEVYNKDLDTPIEISVTDTYAHTTKTSPAITIEYLNNENANTKLDFFLGHDHLSNEYNFHSLGTKRDPELYINARINKRKAAENS